jgi:hypothetical protein
MIRRTPGRKLALLTLAAVLALGLAACGDDDGGNAADTTTTTEAEEKGSDSIRITYQDFAYEVSGPLTAGGTIELSNAGKEFHMIHAIKLNDGKTLKDVQALLEQESGGGDEGGGDETTTTEAATTETSGDEGGGGEQDDPFADLGEDVGLPSNFMSPGAKAAVTVPDLEPGSYAIMCFIPVEGGEGEPHFARGMINQFKVVEGETPATPSADATYKVSKGKAVEGPATLTAGEHTIRFEGVGDGAGDLEPGIGKVNAGTTFAQLDKVLSDLFEGEAPPPKGAASTIPGSVVFGGGNLNDLTGYYVRVTLDAGTWFVVAEDGDDEDDPSPPKELIQIKVS